MPLQLVDGYEQGTHLGLTTGNTGNKYADIVAGTLGTNIQLLSAAAYSPGFGLRVSGSGNHVRYSTDSIGTSKTSLVRGMRWRASTDPNATMQFFVMYINTVSEAGLKYNPSTNKIQADGADFTVNQDANSTMDIAANEWVWVDLWYDCSANPHVMRWMINGVEQPTATAPNAATTFSNMLLGQSTVVASTGASDFDDGVTSTTGSDYPLGIHRVVVSTVDPADTVTITGTTGNFATMSNNGTITAWNATTARGAVDELPPTISASADGAVQQTTATGDCMNFPMTTVPLGDGELCVGGRMVACGWAASTSAGTIGFRSFNGTTETILQAGTVDPNFDNSTTAPSWVCKMLTAADFDTQAEIDAAVIRVGFSNNAGVDQGIHAVYIEFAVKQNPQPILNMAAR